MYYQYAQEHNLSPSDNLGYERLQIALTDLLYVLYNPNVGSKQLRPNDRLIDRYMGLDAFGRFPCSRPRLVPRPWEGRTDPEEHLTT